MVEYRSRIKILSMANFDVSLRKDAAVLYSVTPLTNPLTKWKRRLIDWWNLSYMNFHCSEYAMYCRGGNYRKELAILPKLHTKEPHSRCQ